MDETKHGEEASAAEKAACFQLVEAVQKPGQTFDETMDYYTGWVATYRSDLEVVGYQSPALAASNLAKLNLPKDIKILDVACGTGWVACILRDKYGYKNFDGLDASVDMIEEAKKVNIYGKIFCNKIGDGSKVPEIPDSSYDAVTFAGGLVSGHIKLDAFEEIIRFCKPGGYIVASMLEENRRTVDEYLHMDEYLKELEERGLWEKVAEYITPNYYKDLEGAGLSLVYRVKSQ